MRKLSDGADKGYGGCVGPSVPSFDWRRSGIFNGNLRRCPCLKEFSMPPRVDLAGKRFGRLLALYPVIEQRGERLRYFWSCQCDCGVKSLVDTDHAHLRSA